ncbi:MAG TPA: zinc-dependent metalloprotease [Gemmatimonadaceae bacterium]|nr:zinc-dependent metalloprotease [Gemmatimonadaceae bacterium]
MRHPSVCRFLTLCTLALSACASRAQDPAPAPTPQQQPGQAGEGQTGQQRRRARPYAQVVTDRAVTDTGGITVHRVDDRWLFEVPDSLMGRDFLLVSRIAGVPANFGGFLSAGTSLEERVVRWERQRDRIILRTIAYDAVADDSLPIAISVASNNVGAILAAFPIEAYGKDSASYVIEVGSFFTGDTPALSGLSPAQRRQYQVRRLDPARSFLTAVKAFPQNVEVRHTQTFEATEPPADRASGTISLDMRQSIVLLPRVPMRPRYADPRAGFFAVTRVNYGLDVQKADSQSFIRRWRLEPKDPAAYARGELVEPVKPIVYYIDPATPTRWRPYVRMGIEDWQKPFEKAGFKNAIIAKDPPTAAEDPDWDPEDIRYSVVRWAASLVRNAVGPSTSDPRTGEIIESDITFYHNHMRSYRNRLLIETGAANPVARTLDMPEALMGETMRKVITHEVGHAIGLPHNMIASSSIPIDSLRSASFASRYGVSLTIMDYARQNYIAQPGDSLTPTSFVRRLGPFDDFIVNWGYRVIPEARTPEEERPILDRWLREQTGSMRYRYLPQYLAGVDPRSQTEDIGDDPVRASTYAIENLKRVVPNLVAWTTRDGDDYSELNELYGEALGMWARYMGHVVSVIGGIEVDLKTADQDGVVFTAVDRERQQAALRFLGEQAFRTPSWLAPDDILARIGPPAGQTSLVDRQAAVVTQLLDTRRLGRLAQSEAMNERNAYPPAVYLADLRRAMWGAPGALTTPDANRRTLQRVYLERLAALVEPPEPPSGGGGQGGGGGGGPQQPPSPLLVAPNVPRTDLPALARSQLRAIQADARRAAGTASSAVVRAHWQDVADRVEKVLTPD